MGEGRTDFNPESPDSEGDGTFLSPAGAGGGVPFGGGEGREGGGGST